MTMCRHKATPTGVCKQENGCQKRSPDGSVRKGRATDHSLTSEEGYFWEGKELEGEKRAHRLPLDL